MKKCALITYHMSRNCGSFLQTYALQTAVESMGHECTVIHYVSPEQEKVYNILQKNDSVRNILKNIWMLFHYPIISRHKKSFHCIQKNFLHLTPKCSDETALSQLEKNYDVFISGSDQIWNMEAWDYSDAYFLPFIQHKRKISYASSFGDGISKMSEVEKTRVSGFTTKYAKLSVRENSGSIFLSECLRRDVSVVLDPTLLLKREDYDCIALERKDKKKYIFLYSIFSLKMDTDFIEQVQQISKKMKLPVLMMYTGNKVFLARKYDFKLVKETGPAAFLSLIRGAEMVFTNSFHGTAFSLIYEKNFWISKNCDDRIRTLLFSTGSENRLLQSNSVIGDPVDYGTVNMRLEQHRRESYAFLEKGISEGSTDEE